METRGIFGAWGGGTTQCVGVGTNDARDARAGTTYSTDVFLE